MVITGFANFQIAKLSLLSHVNSFIVCSHLKLCVHIEGENQTIAVDCKTPPWESNKMGEWICKPLTPPHKECILSCGNEGVTHEISGSVLTFSCDETLEVAWNASQIESCDILNGTESEEEPKKGLFFILKNLRIKMKSQTVFLRVWSKCREDGK